MVIPRVSVPPDETLECGAVSTVGPVRPSSISNLSPGSIVLLYTPITYSHSLYPDYLVR